MSLQVGDVVEYIQRPEKLEENRIGIVLEVVYGSAPCTNSCKVRWITLPPEHLACFGEISWPYTHNLKYLTHMEEP